MKGGSGKGARAGKYPALEYAGEGRDACKRATFYCLHAKHGAYQRYSSFGSEKEGNRRHAKRDVKQASY